MDENDLKSRARARDAAVVVAATPQRLVEWCRIWQHGLVQIETELERRRRNIHELAALLPPGDGG